MKTEMNILPRTIQLAVFEVLRLKAETGLPPSCGTNGFDRAAEGFGGPGVLLWFSSPRVDLGPHRNLHL